MGMCILALIKGVFCYLIFFRMLRRLLGTVLLLGHGNVIDAQFYDFCLYQVICGVNYGTHPKQCLLLNKHHSLMRIWLCKLEELKKCSCSFVLYT